MIFILNLTTNFEGVQKPNRHTHTYTVHFMTNCQQGADEISTSYFYHHINILQIFVDLMINIIQNFMFVNKGNIIIVNNFRVEICVLF